MRSRQHPTFPRSRNPGARHFGRGGTLAEGWRTPGRPLAHGLWGLAKGGERGGGHWRHEGGDDSTFSAAKPFVKLAISLGVINWLANATIRGCLHLRAVASNGRVLRTLAVARPSRPPGLSHADRAVLELARLGNNLNQLARAANASGRFAIEESLRDLVEQIHAIIRGMR